MALHLERTGRRATVTVDAPPMNLMTLDLYGELRACVKELAADDELSVVVFRSADPEWFIAHFDVEAILGFPVDDDPRPDGAPNPFHTMVRRLRAMGAVTIAQLEGRVGGGGSEFAAACDLRFGVRGRTIVNQMEVPLGILPGGGGTQHLPRLVGRARALEIIVGADDLDADTAERWGYLNRVFEPDEIGPFVDRLADRIASFPPEAVRQAKASVDAAEGDLDAGLAEEDWRFRRLLATDAAPDAMRGFLAAGGQTPEGERRVADTAARAWNP